MRRPAGTEIEDPLLRWAYFPLPPVVGLGRGRQDVGVVFPQRSDGGVVDVRDEAGGGVEGGVGGGIVAGEVLRGVGPGGVAGGVFSDWPGWWRGRGKGGG